MKKILLVIALCLSPALVMAAQTPVTQIDKFNSAATKIDDMRVATSVRLAAAQSNFTELYTLLGGTPWPRPGRRCAMCAAAGGNYCGDDYQLAECRVVDGTKHPIKNAGIKAVSRAGKQVVR